MSPKRLLVDYWKLLVLVLAMTVLAEALVAQSIPDLDQLLLRLVQMLEVMLEVMSVVGLVETFEVLVVASGQSLTISMLTSIVNQ